MAEPVDLNEQNFAAEVAETPGVVLVDFWSRTCPHCQHFAPQFAEAAQTGPEGVRFAKVCAQEAEPLFGRYDVYAVPTMVLFRDGAEVARQAGARSAEQVLSWLETQLR